MKKLERINAQLVKEITYIIKNKIEDPRLDNQLFTVTSVETSQDLKTAKVRVSFIDSQNASEYINILNAASSFIKKLLFHQVRIRAVPSLRFTHDSGIDHANKIEQILSNLNKENNKYDELD